MITVVNRVTREIGILCKPVSIILGVGESKEITAEQLEEIDKNSVSLIARIDRVFDVLEDGVLVRPPGNDPRRPHLSKPSLDFDAPRGPLVNYHRRNADGTTTPIKSTDTENYIRFLVFTTERVLRRSEQLVSDIRKIVSDQEKRWFGQTLIDDEAVIDILFDLELQKKAETLDGGLTWAVPAKKRRKRKRDDFISESKRVQTVGCDLFEETPLGTFDAHHVESDVLIEAIRANRRTLIDELALGRPAGDIMPPPHYLHDEFRDYVRGKTKKEK